MKTSIHALFITSALSLLSSAPLHAADLTGLSIPWPLKMENTAVFCRVISPTELDLESPGRADLFISPDGKHHSDKSPRLLFRPEGPFIFSAKIKPEFKTKWDAGVLLLFNDPEHFAKFCYEVDYQGVSRIVSVVCNGVADDSNAMPVPEGAVYFRIVGSGTANTFTFYSSSDGKSWFLLRTFRLAKTDSLRVGFSAQSPVGEGCLVHFTQIGLEQRAPKDFWAGN